MKKNTPSGSMSRRAFFLALLGGTTMAMLPQNALAQTSDTLTGIGPDDRLAISRSGNCIQIIDTATGEVTSGVVSADGRSIRVTESSGNSFVANLDDQGNIVLNGEIVVERLAGTPRLTGGLTIQSVPSGYRYLSKYRTSTKVTGTIASITVTLMGLIPGLQYAAAIAAILLAIKSGTNEDVYLEVTQYYHPRTLYMYDVVRYYRNSNYTGRERVCQDDFCKFSKFKYLSAEKSPNISCLHIS